MIAQRNLVAAVAVLLVSAFLAAPLAAQPPQGDSSAALDVAIALLNDARARMQGVRDYECLLVKRERVKGTLLPESVATMKVRSQPFAIYLRCETGEDEGLEVCYAEGRNRGMMRVHPTGAAGLLGFFTIDPRDPRAFEKNRHCITDAGLANLLDSTARYWQMERQLNKTEVILAEEVIAGRACTRIETIHPDRNAGSFYGYRCVLWLDQETHLPVGAETYDWPREGGPAGGEVLEAYRFVGVRCNVGVPDSTFAH